MKSIKAILFDVDGVLIRLPYYFSKELKLKGYEKVEESLNAYYCGSSHLLSLEGKAECDKLITPHLSNFGWEYSADEYLKQQFDFEREYLDSDMISIICKLRTKGVKCYLATDQEKHRAQYLLESMNFNSFFDSHFISCFVGSRKCHDYYWIHVTKELKNAPLGIEPDEIAFFDDMQEYVDIASKFGIKAFLFKNLLRLKEDLALLGLNEIQG